MNRSPEKIKADIAQVRRELSILPQALLDEGYGEDYQGRIDALEEELQRIEAPEESFEAPLRVEGRATSPFQSVNLDD